MEMREDWQLDKPGGHQENKESWRDNGAYTSEGQQYMEWVTKEG